jgi:hypothetical protein
VVLNADNVGDILNHQNELLVQNGEYAQKGTVLLLTDGRNGSTVFLEDDILFHLPVVELPLYFESVRSGVQGYRLQVVHSFFVHMHFPLLFYLVIKLHLFKFLFKYYINISPVLLKSISTQIYFTGSPILENSVFLRSAYKPRIS